MSIEPIRQPSRHGGDPIMRTATMGICAMLGLTALTSLLFAPGELLIAVVRMGWIIVWPGRLVAARVVIGLIDRQVAQLKEQQNQLVRDWGRRVLEED
jgi:hypothetical protein